jgi:hypothetical protein
MNVKIFFFIGILPIYIIAAINLIIDPYEVFQTKYLSNPGAVQERFLKINYIKNNSFDEIILGSSRVGTIDTQLVNTEYGKNLYNFYISSGNMAEFEYIIAWISENSLGIKSIYIQIDWPENYGLFDNNLHYQLHPLVVKKSKVDFYKNYIFTPQFEAIRFKLKNNYSFEKNEWDFRLDTGSYTFPNKDKLIELDCAKYQEETGYFKNQSEQSVLSQNQSLINQKTLRAISRIKKVSNDNNINLILFTTPHNKNFINKINLDEYIKFINEIAKISDFYNLMFYNEFTTNNCNYYETSHYTKSFTIPIFDALEKQSNSVIARYITSKNLDSEIEFLKNNFKINRN